jgi:hypothetical protein
MLQRLLLRICPQRDYAATLRLCDSSVEYALTGSIFARER